VTTEIIDTWITAEIPGPRKDSLGYILVFEHMMHGPCGEKKLGLPMYEKEGML
jgi:hypothetical protein